MILEYNLDENINWEIIDPEDRLNEEEAEIASQKCIQANYDYAEDADDTEDANDAVTASEMPEDLNASDEPILPAPLQQQETAVVSIINPFDRDQYNSLKTALRKHFIYQWNRGLISWPRKSTRKRKPGWLAIVEERAITDSFYDFVAKESTLRAWNPEENKWNKSIGNGLFTLISFKKNNEIIRFNGKYICYHDWLTIKSNASVNDEWRYVVEVEKKMLYLNCYGKFKQGLCYASFANDHRNCVVAGSDSEYETAPNAKLVVEPRTKRVYLRAMRDIAVGEEILWNYGDDFFPSQDSASLQSAPSQYASSDSTYTPSNFSD